MRTVFKSMLNISISKVVVLLVSASLLAETILAAPPQTASTVSPSVPLTRLRDWIAIPRGTRSDLHGEPWAKAPLTRMEADQARQWLSADHAAEIRAARET